MQHILETRSEYFQATKSYAKNFEVRPDRGFKTGDLLILKEQDKDTGELTGAEIKKEVTYCLKDKELQAENDRLRDALNYYNSQWVSDWEKAKVEVHEDDDHR